jgi:hypothetical protein
MAANPLAVVAVTLDQQNIPLRNRLQITFQKENDSSQASAVFSAQNAKVKNCACLTPFFILSQTKSHLTFVPKHLILTRFVTLLRYE